MTFLKGRNIYEGHMFFFSAYCQLFIYKHSIITGNLQQQGVSI
jgi:hypothetical protein